MGFLCGRGRTGDDCQLKDTGAVLHSWSVKSLVPAVRDHWCSYQHGYSKHHCDQRGERRGWNSRKWNQPPTCERESNQSSHKTKIAVHCHVIPAVG